MQWIGIENCPLHDKGPYTQNILLVDQIHRCIQCTNKVYLIQSETDIHTYTIWHLGMTRQRDTRVTRMVTFAALNTAFGHWPNLQDST